MILREPVSLAFALITVLIFAFSGVLFDDFYTKAQRDCHKKNAALYDEGKLGPLAPCLKG